MADDIPRLNAALAGRYAIDREIGRGGMATVYLARDLRHRRQVAIKVLRPEVAAQVGAERFLREITIAAQLHHPHILPLHDSGDADGFLFYVMPYVEGKTLRDRLVAEGRLPIADTLRILLDVVDALSHAHAQSVVHRDIKPENVMLSDRHAWLADFGVAKALSETTGRKHQSTAGMALGTPAYMSPEQAAADPQVDHRADIYTVGILAYELLTGAPPFSGMTPRQTLAAHLTELPAPVTSRRQDTPKTLAAIVDRCLAKEPRDRFESADDLRRYLEGHLTPGTGITPSDTQPIPAATPSRRPGRVAALAGAVALVAAGGALLLRGPSETSLNPNLLAVAPFEVLDPEQQLWREGLVDVLSATLDGAGPLRSVAPTVVINRWSGRADPASAGRLGRNVGAGLVVFGRLVASGEDSIRLAASLFDVASDRVIGEVELRDVSANVDRLADTLAVHLMSELSGRRGLGAMRLQSFGSSDPQAVKAFLQGEQHYRRASWDSARGYYARAIQLDRSFALAYSRMGRVHEWRKGGDHAVPFALRAGGLNRGLAPRESLLIAVDSIDAALYSFAGDTTGWSLLRRLFLTLDRATELYPLDPVVWYRLGEARYHWGAYAEASSRAALEAFQRAVELDSTFAPAYIHLIELTSSMQRPGDGRRAIDAYLALEPAGDQAEGIAFAARLLERSPGDSMSLDSALDTLSADAVRAAASVTARIPDRGLAAVRLARAVHRRAPDAETRQELVRAAAYRGLLDEARVLVSDADIGLYSELAELGAIAPGSAARTFAGWLLDREGTGIWHALSWWARHGDAASLARARTLWDSLRSATPPLTPADTAEWNHLVRTADAYLALAAGDTAAALRRFAAIRTWPWEPYYRERLTHARLLAGAGRWQEAGEILDHTPVPRSQPAYPGEVLWQLERGRVHERLGNHEEAVRSYRYVEDVWASADALLRPVVDEAAAAIARLGEAP